MKKWLNILLIMSLLFGVLSFSGCSESNDEPFSLPSAEAQAPSPTPELDPSPIQESPETKQWGEPVLKDESGEYIVQEISDLTFKLPSVTEYSCESAQNQKMYKITNSDGKSMFISVSCEAKKEELHEWELSIEEKQNFTVGLDHATEIHGQKAWIRTYVYSPPDFLSYIGTGTQYIEERYIDYKDNIYNFYCSIGVYSDESEIDMEQQKLLFNEIIESIVFQ